MFLFGVRMHLFTSVQRLHVESLLLLFLRAQVFCTFMRHLLLSIGASLSRACCFVPVWKSSQVRVMSGRLLLRVGTRCVNREFVATFCAGFVVRLIPEVLVPLDVCVS